MGLDSQQITRLLEKLPISMVGIGDQESLVLESGNKLIYSSTMILRSKILGLLIQL